MSGRYFDLDHLQIGGHHLALGFWTEEDRDHIHDQRTDRGVHHRLGEAHALVHGEIGQQRRNSPAETQANIATAATRTSGPWNEEYYVNFGQSHTRDWAEAVRYGFVSAGGNNWYSGPLKRLGEGDRIWVKAPQHGFVGVGKVTKRAMRATEFSLPTPEGDRPALEVLKDGTYHREFADDPDKSEYFIGVRWLDTVPLELADYLKQSPSLAYWLARWQAEA